MNKLTRLKIVIVAILGVSIAVGCKKDQHKVEEKIEKLSENYEKERLFLSNVLSVPLEKVVFDKKGEQFVVEGWNKMSLKTAQELYANANEYKLIYEN